MTASPRSTTAATMPSACGPDGLRRPAVGGLQSDARAWAAEEHVRPLGPDDPHSLLAHAHEQPAGIERLAQAARGVQETGHAVLHG